MFKTCTTCGQRQPVSEFYRSQRNADGLRGECSSCGKKATIRWQLANPEKAGSGSAKALLRSARKHRPKELCTLTKDWIEERLNTGVCSVTGIPFVRGQFRSPYAPSLDRIDPSGEYEPDNVQVILWGLNCAKGVASQEEFLTFLRHVSEAVLARR